MSKSKVSKKKGTPKQLYISFGSYGEISVWETAKEAFEEGQNVVNLYDFNRKQQIVVKLEDVK